MSKLQIIAGNIFKTQSKTIVNTINCLGVMGAGIAFECRLRYPEMYTTYVQLCKEKKIDIGTLWLHKSDVKWILNFPTKYHWKNPSKIEYLEKGLQKFIDSYRILGITSVAFPVLGARNGRIPEDISLDIMKRYLDKCEIDIEIYLFDPNVYDDLFLKFKHTWNSIPDNELSIKSGLESDYVLKIKDALGNDSFRSMSSLLNVNGINDVLLERAFHFALNYR